LFVGKVRRQPYVHQSLLNLMPGRTYTVSFWGKIDSAIGTGYVDLGSDGVNFPCRIPLGSSTYQQYSCTFQPNSMDYDFCIQPYNGPGSDGGKVDIDDIDIR